MLGILFLFPSSVCGGWERSSDHPLDPLSLNVVVNRVKYTLILCTSCICLCENWLASVAHMHSHTHSLTFLGPTELSQAVVDAGAIPLLVLCIQEPEIALKRIAASALSDISKHSPELAQTVVDAGAIAHLAQMILNPDAKLKVMMTSQRLHSLRKWKHVQVSIT